MVNTVAGNYAAESFLSRISQRQQTSQIAAATQSSRPGKSTDTVTISPSSRELLARQTAYANSAKNTRFDTDQGAMNIDIDAYFSPATNAKNGGASLKDLPPLLMPSQENVDALVNHLSKKMPAFLAENNIPTAPSSISYDTRGQIQLPADYAYADEFKEALAKNPTMERELRTVNALSSHLAEMKKSIPFQQEYAAATTEAAARAIIEKYSNLFMDNRSYDSIALNFSEDGRLSVTANGEPLA